MRKDNRDLLYNDGIYSTMYTLHELDPLGISSIRAHTLRSEGDSTEHLYLLPVP